MFIKIPETYEVYKVNENKYIVKNKVCNRYVTLSKKNLEILEIYFKNNSSINDSDILINYLNSIDFFNPKSSIKFEKNINNADYIVGCIYNKLFFKDFYLKYTLFIIFVGFSFCIFKFYSKFSLTIPWIIINIFFHELGHAITCKHYKREIISAGFKLHYGFPAFYIDTTDICMSSKKNKILVSLFGPLSNFMLFIGFYVGEILIKCSYLQFKSFSLIFFLFNLIPLFKLDGYFILNDIFETNSLQKYEKQYIKSKFLYDIKNKKLDKKHFFIVMHYLCEKLFKLIILFLLVSYFINLVKVLLN